VAHSPLDDFARDALCPVGFLGKRVVYEIEIEPDWVVGNDEIVAAALVSGWRVFGHEKEKPHRPDWPAGLGKTAVN
jgi:hypothetical protein